MLTELELKEKLIAEISDTEDTVLLHQILQLIDLEKQNHEVYEMCAEEEIAVNEGLAQLDRGEFVPHEDVKTLFEKWLKK